MKNLSLALAISIVAVNTAFAAHTKDEHVEKHVETEKRAEISVNESVGNQRQSTVNRNLVNTDVNEATTGLIYSEEDPYKDLDF